VVLEIGTGNGTITFHGTLDPDKGKINGNYTIAGGTCDENGTGVFDITTPWDY
jgi:hypothetical protein